MKQPNEIPSILDLATTENCQNHLSMAQLGILPASAGVVFPSPLTLAISIRNDHIKLKSVVNIIYLCAKEMDFSIT